MRTDREGEVGRLASGGKFRIARQRTDVNILRSGESLRVTYERLKACNLICGLKFIHDDKVDELSLTLTMS